MNLRLLFFLSFRLLFKYKPSQKKLLLVKLPFFSIFLIGFCIFIPLLVLSITNGFQNFTLNKLQGFYAPYFIHLNTPLLKSSKQDNSYFTFFQDYVLLNHDESNLPVLIRAYDEALKKKNPLLFSYSLLKGTSFPVDKNSIVLSEFLSYSLGVDVGDTIKIISLNPNSFHSLIQSSLKVSGVISFSSASLDIQTALINKEALPSIFGFNHNTINFIGAINKKALINFNNENHSSYKINTLRDIPLIREIKNQQLFLQLIFLTISFVCFFAVFISSHITLLNHQKSMALFKIMGMNKNNITLLFMLQGFILGIIGIMVGLSLTCIIIPHIQEMFSFLELYINNMAHFISHLNPHLISPLYHFSIMPSSIFYVSIPPVTLFLQDFILQTPVVLICVVLASFIPSLKLYSTSLITSLKLSYE